MSLIHMVSNAKSKNDQNTVVNLSDIDSNVMLEKDMAEAKFITLTFPTVKEARNRAIVLALLTCDIRKPRQTFLPLFTKANFCSLKDSQ